MGINVGLRVAVVGAGYWGPKHVRVLHGTEGVGEVVLVDGRPDRLQALARSYPGDRTCASLPEALPHVDAVVVATPPSTHVALASAAMEAGKHVLVEKPLAPSVADARRLVALADAAGVTLMVGHTFEYNPAVRKLRELIEQRELGDLFYLDSARLNLGLYQSDVNVIFDLAPHDVSIINHVLGTSPVAVQAWGARHAHPRFEDVAYLRLFYEDHGLAANIHVSWLDPGKVRRVVAVGSRRMAVYDDLAEERIRVLDKGVDPPASAAGGSTQPPMSYRYGDIVSPFLAPDEPLALQDAHFVECASTGAVPLTDGRNGLAVVEVLEAAQLSLRLGHPVLLEELAADSRPVYDIDAPARFVAVSVPWYRRDRSGAALIREGA
ncbi:Gfo/Idh/MocA family protein [Actinocatenispora rupis]|uniref:Oxidoreductase n=1 Tax=Actinocatenispora rupis TaxID=519421 RepID=A0A8J3J4D1_9ACTN|nr:Gfo/Idh/MocA family oxidoreductase [Actinocatenispora rupis]GID11920.1 oxidoreductase [Actinocatenispora rupis]